MTGKFPATDRRCVEFLLLMWMQILSSGASLHARKNNKEEKGETDSWAQDAVCHQGRRSTEQSKKSHTDIMLLSGSRELRENSHNWVKPLSD